MKYILKQSIPSESDNYIRDYLLSLGIENYDRFLYRPQAEDEINPLELDNIGRAGSILYKHIKENHKFFLVVDSDADGYTSSAIVYQLIKEMNPNCEIQHYMHKGKEHGVVVDTVPTDCHCIIIPDAGSNQIQELTALSDNYDIIVLDHHEVEGSVDKDNVVIVNNQSSEFFENKYLSGAGVAFKFAQYIADRYPQHNINPSKWYDLAALGIISDMMYIGTLDNNYIIRKGLNSIVNPMLQAMLDQQSFSVNSTTNPTPIDIAFYVAPLINGTIRMDNMELKNDLFMGFANPNNQEVFDHTSKGKNTTETFYQKTAREAYNIKNRQNTALEKTMENVCNKIESEGLDQNKIIIYKTSIENPNEVPQTLTGLMAMKLSQKYNKPTLVLRPIKENDVQYYRGSGRGKYAIGFDSFREYLNETSLVDYAQGHAFAFGCGLKDENIESLLEISNNDLNTIDFGDTITEVNYIFNNSNLSEKMLYEFAKYISLYGNGIPQPSFAFELILTKGHFQLIGPTRTTVKLKLQGIDFIKMKDKALSETINEMSTGYYKVRIIGRSQLNNFKGNITTQVRIDDIEILPMSNVDFL